jgi:DnaJ domain
MKDYYQILGVSNRASAAEIKRAFRRLAITYHPDRNASAEAEGIIKDVIEAYKVLDDPYLRAQYDHVLSPAQSPVATPNHSKPHRDPRYRSQPRNPNYKSEKQVMLEMMQANLPYAMYASYFTAVFTLILLLDFTLPPRFQIETVRAVETEHVRYQTEQRIVTDDGNEFKLSKQSSANFRKGATLSVASSPWLGVPLSLTNIQTHEVVRLRATIYGNFMFAPVVLLITSLLAVFYRRGIMLSFNLGIVNALLFFLTILFLLIHHIRIT